MREEWINAIGKMTYGIYVLTSSYKEEINGMIASWVSQISYEPPLIIVAVHTNRYSHHIIERGGCFAVHVLRQDQRDFLTRFKGSDPKAKFSSLRWNRGITGCPILADCQAYLECDVTEHLKPGNHTLYIGQVVDAEAISDTMPLSTLDYEGIYLGNI